MSIRDASVRLLQSSDSGAPALTETTGDLLAVLQAALVTGYGSVTATSLVVSSGVATLTVAAGHNMTDPGTDIGVVVRVEGVTGALSDLNDDWRATVDSATVLSWECGLADGTATGTITVKRAPCGFTNPYSGTNVEVFRLDSVYGTGGYLRVDQSTTDPDEALVKAYVTMTDIDTGTHEYPDTGDVYWAGNQSTGNAPWVIVGDSRGAYYSCEYVTIPRFATHYFGEPIFFDSGNDSTLLLAGSGGSNAYTNIYRLNIAALEMYMSHDAAGLEASTKMLLRGIGSYSSGEGLYGSNMLAMESGLLQEQTSEEFRGRLPGWLHFLTNVNQAFGTALTLQNVGPVVILQDFSGANSYMGISLDPWRT